MSFAKIALFALSMAIGSQVWAQEYGAQIGNVCYDKNGHSYPAQILSPNYSICRSADCDLTCDTIPRASWCGQFLMSSGTKDADTNSVRAITLPEGVVVETCGADGRGTPISGGVSCIELSPDQKLARAFALCQRNSIRHLFDVGSLVTHGSGIFAYTTDPKCLAVTKAWLSRDESADDRTFIESVAKDLLK